MLEKLPYSQEIQIEYIHDGDDIMKNLFIEDLSKIPIGNEVDIKGWIKNLRTHREYVFLDLVDSTGKIQVIFDRKYIEGLKLSNESSVDVIGKLSENRNGMIELKGSKIDIIGNIDIPLYPPPRTNFKVLGYTDLVLDKRHLMLRNPKIMSILRFRHNFIKTLHNYFDKNGFVEINAPILTQIPLYEEHTAFKLDFFGTDVFLTQCVAFYLEAAVHAFEKVYNIGPSFRAEESKGRRHLAEYWHVKTEIAWANLNDIIQFTEELIYSIVKNLVENSEEELKNLKVEIDTDALQPPYERISYDEALGILKNKGISLEWGRSLGADEEKMLSENFDSPFWVSGMPKTIEPFPYVIDEKTPHVTKTADLLVPNGYGEILGVAEKIWRYDQLIERMREKGINPTSEKYRWYLELRQYGSVPHSGLGMGVERTIRWLLKLPHVRDAIPFPRMFQRKPYP
jgi:asparaginyl-tRNA synthetase